MVQKNSPDKEPHKGLMGDDAAKAHGVFVLALAAMMGMGCLISAMQKNGTDIGRDDHMKTTLAIDSIKNDHLKTIEYKNQN